LLNAPPFFGLDVVFYRRSGRRCASRGLDRHVTASIGHESIRFSWEKLVERMIGDGPRLRSRDLRRGLFGSKPQDRQLRQLDSGKQRLDLMTLLTVGSPTRRAFILIRGSVDLRAASAVRARLQFQLLVEPMASAAIEFRDSRGRGLGRATETCVVLRSEQLRSRRCHGW